MARKILVIDDEQELLEVVEEVLEGNGYQVVTAKSGAEGVQLAIEEEPDLIMLDIAMPKMDGLEVLSRLRGIRETSTVPVIMLTGKGSTDNIFQAERNRATEFLIKPVPSGELLHIIQRSFK